MDRKSVIILALCGVLFVVWSYLTPKLYPPKPVQGTNVAAGGTNIPASSPPPTAADSRPPVALPDGFSQPASDEPEQTLVVSNNLVRLTFTSHGGGIKTAELVRHRASVSCSAKKLEGYHPVILNGPARLPVLALTGSNSLTGDGVFRLTKFSRPASRTTNNVAVAATEGIRAEKLLSNGVFFVKEFELSGDYLIKARIRFENRGTSEVAVPPQNWMVGAATPLSAQDDEQAVGLFWSDGSRDTQINNAYFENRTLGCLPGTPRSEYSVTSPSVKWAAAKNQFFFIAVIPEVPGTGVAANKFPLPPPASAEVAANARTLPNQYAFNVVLSQAPTNLAVGGVFERNFDVYAGPKEYRRLERLAAEMKTDVDKIMEFGFFGFFSRLLLLSMNGLNSLGLSYALAIIAITVIIKLLFWPLTQASTRSMKRMGALQPQMKAIQEKYKEDPAKMNKRMMEFMREHKVSPLGGCLPLLLQIPVFIGFFQMVRTAIELRGASFLWACDLSSPDTLFVIPGLNFNVNPLPLLMGATMFWQARLTPPAPGMDPMQQKIMKYFPLFFLFLLYNYSAGLTLYWTVQNLLSIAQTKLTKTHEPSKTPEPVKPAAKAPKRKK